MSESKSEPTSDELVQAVYETARGFLHRSRLATPSQPRPMHAVRLLVAAADSSPTMEAPLRDLAAGNDDGADSFALAASAHGGAVRLRASGRRTPAADHHDHRLHIRLFLEYESVCPPPRRRRRVLRGNKSGGADEFLALGPDARAGAVARLVSSARLPPGCAGAVERFCARAAALGRERRCDDVTVNVDWMPARQEEGRDARPSCEAAAVEDADAGLLSSLASGLFKNFLDYFGF
ncbi:hypothetical protein ACP70R_011373 [Stipagrostis hirtigluma subsp. patula]